MKRLYVSHRDAWRTWLRKNAHRAGEIWLVFYKKHTGKPSIPYDDAVEEALCFGWIDGKVMRYDEARYLQRFTPRKPASRWSSSNVRRAKKMISLRKMTPAGLAVYRPERAPAIVSAPTQLPKNLERLFRAKKRAWANFGGFPPYYRKMSIAWVASAKQEETQRRRLQQLIQASARKQRLQFI